MSDYGDPTGGAGFDPGSAQGGSEDPFDGLSEYGKNYLNGVEEAERHVVAKHLKGWDKGANSQFQKIHSDYRPYRDLGDLQTVQQGMNFVRRFQTDPQGTLRLLLEGEFLKPEDLHGLIQQQAPTAPSGGEADSDLERTLQKLLDQKLGGVTKQQETLAQQLQSFQQQQQANEGRRELDKAINGLKTKYGSDWSDFVENQVLAMAAQANIPLDQAAEMVVGGLKSYAQSKLPPRAGFSMPGVGSAASFNKNPADLSDEEQRKAYVAAELARRMQR